MMIRRYLPLVLSLLPALLYAQPAKDDSASRLVEMFDQGEVDPQLAGIQTPRGIRVEVVATAALAGDLRAMVFDDDGGLLVLQAIETNANGRLVRLTANGAEGVFDKSEIVIDKLETPGGLLAHGGWIYWTSGGRVLRRRPFEAELLRQLQADATDKRGPPTTATADGRWIEQTLAHGLGGQLPFSASSLSLGSDGWLYLACGSDQRGESWDGSQVRVARSGAIVRMRPDGSRLEEFARGLNRPFSIAGLPLGPLIVGDRDWDAAGSRGQRLLAVLAGGDYGWRHAKVVAAEKDRPAASIIPDPLRARSNGERPGTLPAMHVEKTSSIAGLVAWDSASFPDFCRGRVAVLDPQNHRVWTFRPIRGDGFRADSPFDLLSSGEAAFLPVAAAVGPDGALYVADQTAGKAGRILRLSWGGTAAVPAIALAPRDSWSKLRDATDDELLALLKSSAGETLRRTIQQLVLRGKSAGALRLLVDDTKSLSARAAALGVVSQLPDAAGREALLKLLGDKDAEIVRLAADAVGDLALPDEAAQVAAAEAVKSATATTDPTCHRALQLAQGKIAAAAKSVDMAEWTFEGTSVTHGPMMSRYVFDGHVRALELVPGAAQELMLGNLDVALNLPETDPRERQRIKEFVVLTAEAMRTRQLSDFLDALLQGEEDLFVRLEAPLEIRLLGCYRNVLVDPPITADAVAAWLEKHPGGPSEVEIAALEVMSAVGVTKPAAIDKLAERLLSKPADAVALANSLLAGRLDRSLLPKIKTALTRHAEKDPTGEVAAVLKQLPK